MTEEVVNSNPYAELLYICANGNYKYFFSEWCRVPTQPPEILVKFIIRQNFSMITSILH